MASSHGWARLFCGASYLRGRAWPIALHMNPNQSPGSAGDPGSHLQFQISLLRLMGQKMPDPKMMGQNMKDPNIGDPAPVSNGPVTSVQVTELERLLRPRSARVRIKKPS